MALPLLSLRANSDQEDYGFQLICDSGTRIILLDSFKDCSHIFPVLLVAQTDNCSSLVEDLLRLGLSPDQQSELGSLFDGSHASEETVCVWPHPIQLGGRSVLLMKMWEFDIHDEDEEKRLIVQRTLSAVLAATCSCWMAFEHPSVYRSLEFVQSLHEQLRGLCGFATQFFLLEQRGKLTRSLAAQSDSYSSKPYAAYTEFLDQGQWQDPFIFIEKTIVQGHQQENYGEMSAIGLWIAKIQSVSRFSSLDVNPDYFIQNFPRFNPPDFEAIETAIGHLEKQHEFLRKASSQNFLVKKRAKYELDQSLLDTLRENFDPECPTVVMVVLGGQGLGKSTFLNHIVRHCSKKHHLKAYFKTANAMTHTTKESQILSCPLYLSNSSSQLMLIDAEGLGAMETGEDEAAILQHNLVSSLLAVSSVPCILVKNEAIHKKVVESYVDRLVFLAHNFGFRCERIHFLFHDKDFRADEVTENEYMKSWIEQLNRQHFGGNPVIKLRNKPLFTDIEKVAMRESFLKELLQDSDFPKLNASGSQLPFGELLIQLQYIVHHNSTDLSEISLSPQDHDCIERECEAKITQLRILCDEVVCDGSEGLVSKFNEKARMSICALDEGSKTARYTRLRLQEAIQNIRLELHRIETNCAIFTSWPESRVKYNIVELLESYYQDSVWIGSFLKICDVLESLLIRIGVHYPSQRSKVENALVGLREQRSSLKKWFIGNYAMQAASLVVTAGFGMAATKARTAYYGSRMAWKALIGGFTSLGSFGAFFKSKTLFAPKTDALFKIVDGTVKGTSAKVLWEEKAMRKFKSEWSKCVVLVVARDGMKVAEMLNEMIQEATFLEAKKADQLFDQGSPAQVISFQYHSPSVETILVLLRLTSSERTREEEIVELVAAALLPCVSVACLFEDKESETEINMLKGTQCVAGAKLCLVIQKSLSDEFKQRMQADVLSWQMGMMKLEVTRIDKSAKTDIKLNLEEAMRNAPIINQTDVKNMIAKAQQSVSGVRL